MKIIDAHFHLFPDSPYATEMARAVGHENDAQHLLAYHRAHDVVGGVVMGNGPLEEQDYPAPFRYCVGLDSRCLREMDLKDAPELVEAHLQKKTCVGVKLYPGYEERYITDPDYRPIYELARTYNKPVAIHTGMTAMPMAKLKYSHPLTLDEVAADFPDVRLVMCHMGNPFLSDAAAVLEKNENVCADLSGLLEGWTDLDRYFQVQAGYVEQLRTWFRYVDHVDKFMFGTDFPAVNVENYIAFIQRLLPEETWEQVFFENANRIYQMNL